jgi:hypothetical protein
VAYSCEESDARLKLLTDKLFSAVQRIGVLERDVAEKQSKRGHVADLKRIEGRFHTVDSNHSSNCRRLDEMWTRLAQLEGWRKACSTAVIPWPAEVLGRIGALESKVASGFDLAQLTNRVTALEKNAQEQAQRVNDQLVKLESRLDAHHKRITAAEQP